MQQGHVAGSQRREGFDHGVEVDPVAIEVIVGVVRELEPGKPQQRQVVGPRRLTQPHGGRRHGPGDDMAGHAQGAAATRGLDRRNAPRLQRRVAGAEEHFLHGLVEPGVSRDGDVALAVLGFDDAPFRALDAPQYGGAPGLVLEHSHAQVHLVWGRVGAKHRHDAENGVGGLEFQIFEHGDFREYCKR